jgi:aminodeoxyfutalosine deaminase
MPAEPAAPAAGALAEFARRMPKVELHVHLEGTFRPPTLRELARRRGVRLPSDTDEGLAAWFQFRDFQHFVEVFLTCSRCLRDPEDFQLLARDFLAEQQRQNVRYCEAHFTISTHVANGVNAGEVGDALWDVMVEEERRRGVRLRLIPDIVRNVGFRAADRTLEWALEHRRKGVVALGLSGFETYPNAPFREHFRVAAQEGLARVAHAGEHGGPDSIRSALEVCGAERLGHGVRAVEDPELLQVLRERAIPLEVCPTSNVRLGVAADLASHPFDELREAGLVLTVNSDDPAFFGTTLADEYASLADAFGYSPADLASFSLAAVRSCFAPEADRRTWEASFREELARLGEELLGQPLAPAERVC